LGDQFHLVFFLSCVSIREGVFLRDGLRDDLGDHDDLSDVLHGVLHGVPRDVLRDVLLHVVPRGGLDDAFVWRFLRVCVLNDDI